MGGGNVAVVVVVGIPFKEFNFFFLRGVGEEGKEGKGYFKTRHLFTNGQKILTKNSFL